MPALAALGAALSLASCVRVMVRAVRDRRAGRHLRVLPVVIGLALVVVFAVVPLTRLVAMLAPAGPDRPRTLSGFGDLLGPEGYPRLDGRHRGLDVAGRPGTAVLAAAGGRVLDAKWDDEACGLIVVIDHEPRGYRTIYCHLAALAVKRGEDVARGQRIGVVGMTGQRAWPGYEHVHWELRRGTGSEDPAPRLGGCFDRSRTYPLGRLVLTYPVPC
jgi:murein DD-endopeptidase MepM/ murein hydrolase activator NlpD